MSDYTYGNWEGDTGGYEYNNPATFEMPTFTPNLNLSAQQPQMPAFTNYGVESQPAPRIENDTSRFQFNQMDPVSFQRYEQPGVLNRLFNPGTQTGVDNLFRAGSVGLSGLNYMMENRNARKANEARQNA